MWYCMYVCMYLYQQKSLGTEGPARVWVQKSYQHRSISRTYVCMYVCMYVCVCMWTRFTNLLKWSRWLPASSITQPQHIWHSNHWFRRETKRSRGTKLTLLTNPWLLKTRESSKTFQRDYFHCQMRVGCHSACRMPPASLNKKFSLNKDGIVQHVLLTGCCNAADEDGQKGSHQLACLKVLFIIHTYIHVYILLEVLP